MKRYAALLLYAFTVVVSNAVAAPDPTALLKGAIDQWRGHTSYTQITMVVHRPHWERSLSMRAWTRGAADSLVRFTRPAKDAGNATLKIGPAMWVFNPKLNQVIKLPASMMSQSWMGSDFSYNDLAKSDSVVNEYTHRLLATSEAGGHRIYTIEAVPKADAPVVWGKQVVKVRDDRILLQEVYFDQDMRPVREMDVTRIGRLGGRIYPLRLVMKPLEKPGRWTRIDYSAGDFDLPLPSYLFSIANLRNPRPWRPQ